MTQTKLSTPYPPLSSPSPTRQVRWPLSKEKKSTTHPKDTYAELVFPCKCFENWEKKKNSPKLIQHWVTRTCSLQLQLKINTHKIVFKKKGEENKTKQNKTKNNSNGKWSKAYYVASSNNNKNKNHFPIWSTLKLLLWFRWNVKKKWRYWKRVSVCILTW